MVKMESAAAASKNLYSLFCGFLANKDIFDVSPFNE